MEDLAKWELKCLEEGLEIEGWPWLNKHLRDNNLYVNVNIGYGYPTWWSFLIQSINNDSLIVDAKGIDAEDVDPQEASWDTYEEALKRGIIHAITLL